MPSAQQMNFAHFRVDLANEQLWHGNKPIPLRRQTFAVLRYLVEHAGQVVSKAALLDALWPGVYVTDMAPMICIRELRKALGDDARVPQCIETVHRRGYRFIAKVVSSQHSVVSSQHEENQKSKGKSQKAKVGFASLAPSPQHAAPTLVGRESELAQLQSWLDKALQHGERQIVFVTGEPGIGKTTLVEVFLEQIHEARGWRLETNSSSPQVSSLQSLIRGSAAASV